MTRNAGCAASAPWPVASSRELGKLPHTAHRGRPLVDAVALTGENCGEAIFALYCSSEYSGLPPPPEQQHEICVVVEQQWLCVAATSGGCIN
jgi:hypothetical protein